MSSTSSLRVVHFIIGLASTLTFVPTASAVWAPTAAANAAASQEAKLIHALENASYKNIAAHGGGDVLVTLSMKDGKVTGFWLN